MRGTLLFPLHRASSLPSLALASRLLTRFFQAIRKHRLGMIGSPSIGQHLIETRIVVVQAQQQFTQVGPRLDPMTLGAGEDREQDGRARPGLLAAQEQPVLSADRLVTERSSH